MKKVLLLISVLFLVFVSLSFAEYYNKLETKSGTYTVKSSLPEKITTWPGDFNLLLREEKAAIVRWQASNPVNNEEVVIIALLLDTATDLSYIVCLVHFSGKSIEVFADEQLVSMGVPSFKLTVIKEAIPVEVLAKVAKNWNTIKKI